MRDLRMQADSLRIALEMEKRGYQLYCRAQQFAQDAEMAALLKGLADDEKRHYVQFAQMLSRLDAPPQDEEEKMIATAMAAEAFFPGGLMQAAMDGAFASTDSMLQEAIRAEEESIAFYQRMAQTLENTDAEAMLLRIIAEEEEHLASLEAQKKTMEEGAEK